MARQSSALSALPRRPAPAHFWLRAALAFLMLFVTLGSLVPLNLVPRDPLAAWQDFLALPQPRLGTGYRIDWAVNFLLLVPIAFAWRHLLAFGRGAAVASAWTLVIAAGLLVFSVGVEFAQSFFPPRNPSFNDVAAQAAGTLVGLALHWLYGTRFDAWLQRFDPHELQPSRLSTLLGAYLALMLAFSVMPLDLSINPVELYRKWRDGRVLLIPFWAPAPDIGLWLYGLVIDILLWVPVGLLWTIDGRRRSPRAVLLRVLLAAAAIEAVQLLVLSRVTDVTDILLAVAGGGLGVLAAGGLRQLSSFDPVGLRRVARLFWWFWLGAIVLVFWLPFDFTPSRLADGAWVDTLTRMPFHNYLFRGEFGALNEIVRKLSFFLPGGLLLGLASGLARRGWTPGAVAVTVGVACLIEAGQMLLPGRVADVTDALLGAAGGLLGIRLGLWLAGGALRVSPR